MSKKSHEIFFTKSYKYFIYSFKIPKLITNNIMRHASTLITFTTFLQNSWRALKIWLLGYAYIACEAMKILIIVPISGKAQGIQIKISFTLGKHGESPLWSPFILVYHSKLLLRWCFGWCRLSLSWAREEVTEHTLVLEIPFWESVVGIP